MNENHNNLTATLHLSLRREVTRWSYSESRQNLISVATACVSDNLASVDVKCNPVNFTGYHMTFNHEHNTPGN